MSTSVYPTGGYAQYAQDLTSTQPKLERPLEELIRRPQWVAWRGVPITQRDGTIKITKRPVNPTSGELASSTDPSTWSTYAAAVAMVMVHKADGIGYVFSAEDPYFGIDLDGCRDPETGAVDPWAWAIVERFDTYSEPSPSGSGLHIIGRGSKPAANSRQGKHIECYDRDRFFTMTLDPLQGYGQIRDCGNVLTAWHRETWPPRDETTLAAPVSLTLEDQDIIDLLLRERDGHGIAGPLLAGDHGAYPSPSEARAALAWKCCFYSDDAAQIARILQSSGLFKPGTRNEERERKARQDAHTALTSYTGPRYDPTRIRNAGPRAIIPPAAPTDAPEISGDIASIEALSIDELRAELQATRRREAAKDRELRAHRQLTESMLTILACDEIEAGPRLTAIGVLLVGIEKREKQERPTEIGYHMPASWIARYTGQTPKTVSGHLSKLASRGVIDRTVTREKIRLSEETIDSDGVIERETRETNGQRNYIAFPENVIDFAERVARYRRDETAQASKHGGERVACQHHPEAGTYTEHITRCRECHEILDRQTTKTSGPPVGDVITWDETATLVQGSVPLESTPKMVTDHPVTTGVPILGVDSGPLEREQTSAPMMGTESVDTVQGYAASVCSEPGCISPIAPGNRYTCADHDPRRLEVAS